MTFADILVALPTDVKETLLKNLDTINVSTNASSDDLFWAVFDAVKKTKDAHVLDEETGALLSKTVKAAMTVLTS